MQPVSPPLAYGIVDIKKLSILAHQYQQLMATGALSVHPFFAAAMEEMCFTSQSVMPDARYIVIAAVYAPPVRVTLDTGEVRLNTFLPSEYFLPGFNSETLVAEIRRSIDRCADAEVAAAGPLPLKALAVGSGLAEYGRNNLAYIRGMGSFHRLYAFFTNAEGLQAEWRFPPIMEACRGCELCSKACPTNAIPLDHFLVHAGRCLTLFNENVGSFPDWLPKEAHNALMGCMRCQWVCPTNRPYILNLDHLATLDEEDLLAIQGMAPQSILPVEVQRKLRRNGSTAGSDINTVWLRNILALLGEGVPVE